MGTGGRFLRRLRARLTDEPTGFIWVKEGAVAASGYPSSKGQISWAAARGLGSILTLTEDPLPPAWTAGMTLDFKHVAMKDHEPPSLESLAEASSYMAEQIAAGKAVLVHCLAGKGRTMCVIAAYLIGTGMGVDESIAFLRRLRPGAIERRQETSVREFGSKSREPSGSRDGA